MSSAARSGPTVIVPSSNTGPAIVTSVQSALAQTVAGVEVLVVDDGSTDEAVSELGRLPDPRLRVLCQPRRGTSAALNLALALAETLWVGVLLPGDRLEPHWAERMLRASDAEPGARAVLAQVGSPDDLLLDLLDRDAPPLSGALLDRRAALAVGGFDPMLRIALDRDLWWRLLVGSRVARIAEPLVAAVGDRLGAFAPSDVATEHAYAAMKALACLRPSDWRPDAASPPSPDDVVQLQLEIARRIVRSGNRALLGHAAALVVQAATSGATVPDDGDLAPLLREYPSLRCATSSPVSGFVHDTPAPAPLELGADDDALRVVFEVATLDRGGLESVVLRLALGMRTRRVRPLVVCTSAGGRGAEQLRAAGVEVVILRGSDADRERDYAQLLSARGVDLVNAHFSNRGVSIAARLGIPVLVTLHNAYAWLGSSLVDEFRRMDRDVAGYVAVSQSVADFTARRFAVAPERIVVIRNGTDLRPIEDRASARAALGIPEHSTLLVQVGRVDPIKSQLALVAAMKQLGTDRPALLAWIVGGVGNASYALRVQRGIAGAGLEGRVVATGERDDVPRILAAADALVMPSIVEGLSLAAVEAMAAGLPVVLTRTGDAGWLLGEEETSSILSGAGVPGILPGALIDGPRFAPHVDGDVLNRTAELDQPEHSGRLAAAIAAVLDDLPRMQERARSRAAELAPLVALDRQLDAYADLFEVVAASGVARGVRRLRRVGRADAERRSAAAERARSLSDAAWPLADLLLEGLDLRRATASLESSLASADFNTEAALERTTRTLDKLRLTHRMRTALRRLKLRLPGGPMA